MSTKVTCEDLDTGESESMIITDDWLLITEGRCYLHHVSKYANGTAVITVKLRGESPEGERQ